MDILADILLVAVLVLFTVSGFRRGIVHSVADLVGSIAAAAAAILYAPRALTLAAPYLNRVKIPLLGSSVARFVVIVVLLFVILEVLVHVLAVLLDRLFRLPVLKQVNSLLGGVFGFCKGAVVVLFACAVLRLALPGFIPLKPSQEWQKMGLSRIYQTVSVHNPLYTMLQTNFWNEVGTHGEKKQQK